MSDTVTCPACGAANPAPPSAAPFFCRQCKAIVDPERRRHRVPYIEPSAEVGLPSFEDAPEGEGAALDLSPPEAAVSPPAPAAHAPKVEPPPADAPSAALPAVMRPPAPPPPRGGASGVPDNYVSRYGTAIPRDLSGPGARWSVGGSLTVGFLLSGFLGVLSGVVFAWIAGHLIDVPLLYPFAMGWLIKHALAAGAGGGTPDRGLLASLVMLGIIVLSFGAFRYVEYEATASRESEQFRATYGTTPVAAVTDPDVALDALRARRPDADGKVSLSDGTEVVLADALHRLVAAQATGKRPSDGYDVELLAESGRPGFRGHVEHQVYEGKTWRFLASAKGMELPGFAVVVLWVFEFVILLLTSIARID